MAPRRRRSLKASFRFPGDSIWTPEDEFVRLLRALGDRRSGGRGFGFREGGVTRGQAFLGREVECDAVSRLVVDHALVTLTGPGGVGKTRLATEVSNRIEAEFPGGVFVVELSGTSDEDDLKNVASRQFEVDSLEAMLLRTADQRTLVVLDNCESSLRQASELAEDLTRGSSAISILATSRSPLQARDERVLAVSPLDLPEVGDAEHGMEAAAMQLFVDRARAAGASWTEEVSRYSEDLGRLVRKLNGLPLAIELAAARSRVVGPKELDALLDQQLDVLARPGPESGRHHSLRSVIDASYQPLDPELQRFFRRLSVMSAPFPMELAQSVAGRPGAPVTDSLDQLSALVDASLIDARLAADGRTEYRLLDSISAYGREQLEAEGESHPVHEHYADTLALLADEILLRALGSFSAEVIGEIRGHFVHLVNAIAWCVEHDPSPARAYRMFLLFWGPTGARAEVANLAKRVQEAWTDSAGPKAEAFAVMGNATFLVGDYSAGASLARQALEHPTGSPMAKLVAHRTLGFTAAAQGDTDEAKANLDRAIEYATPFSESFARELRVSRAAIIVDPDESADALVELDAVRQEAIGTDEFVTIVWSAVVTAYHYTVRGERQAARQAAEAAVVAADRSGLPWSIGTAHRTLACALTLDEGWAAASPHFRLAFEATLEVGDIDAMAMALRTAAGAAQHVRDSTLAEQLWATIPPVPGVPPVRSIFHRLEVELSRTLGPPTSLDGATLTRRVRALLGPVHDRDADGPGTAAVAVEETSPLTGEHVIRFEDCELDLSLQELRRAGTRVPMEPQVFDVLAFLVERRGELVSMDDLLKEVWNDRFVSMAAVSSRIAAVRRATGDDGKAQRIIRTVRGKGFSFVAGVKSAT